MLKFLVIFIFNEAKWFEQESGRKISVNFDIEIVSLTKYSTKTKCKGSILEITLWLDVVRFSAFGRIYLTCKVWVDFAIITRPSPKAVAKS